MRMTVLGGGGAVPDRQRGCSGYLVEEGGFRLLLDPGYGTVLPLTERLRPHDVDAVLVTHGHGDHCADLNPLLRMRHLDDNPSRALPVYGLPGALDPILSVDGDMLSGAYELRTFSASDELTIGPFAVTSRQLAHFVPNAGVRLSARGVSLAYTGDGGADPGVVELAAGAQLLLAEATFVDEVPEHSRGLLSSARKAGEQAAAAGVEHLVLVHLWPTDDPAAAEVAARAAFSGPVSVAEPGFLVDLS